MSQQLPIGHMELHGSSALQARRKFAPILRPIISTEVAVVGDHKVRGRKGEGFPNLLHGVARCVCGAPMRFVRKGSANEYCYLKCSRAVRRKCKHRKLHPYQPIET